MKTKTNVMELLHVNKFVLTAIGFLAAAALLFTGALAFAAGPTVTTDIHNGSHGVITSAPIGTQVHDRVVVASSSQPTPTGTVDFNLYSNTSCSGTPAVESAVALVNGIAESSTTSVPASGLSYLAHYNGDATNTPSDGVCEALTATGANVSVETTLSTSTSVLTGSSVYDTANLLNETAAAGGTVAYTVFSNNSCSTGAQSAGTKTVTNGSVPNSDSIQFNTAGTFYWQAVYSGDANNAGATSSCQSEVLTVVNTQVPPQEGTPGTISGVVYHDKNNNEIKDAGDPGLSGWKVWLHKAATTSAWWKGWGKKNNGYDAPIIATATTDANGNYSFGNLSLGTYFIEEEEQSGWNQTSDDKRVILNDADSSGTVNFSNVTRGDGNNDDNDEGDGDKDNKHRKFFNRFQNFFRNHFNKHDNGNHYGQVKNDKHGENSDEDNSNDNEDENDD